ncbi:MAG: pilus assembly protein PilM [Patescibacteria group bacterium]
MKEVNYDWQVINKSKNISEILISATPKKIAESYSNAVEDSGFFPAVLEPEPLAISRALLPLGQKVKGTEVIIDIGTKYSNFIAYGSGSILFTSSIPTSGEQITKAVAEKLKISWEQAESAKIVCGLNQAQIKEIAEKELAQKIKRSFKYLSANYPEYSNIIKIHLCGGGAYIRGLAGVLSEKLGIPVERGNVFTNIELNRNKESRFFSKEFITSKKLTQDNKVTGNFSLIFATAIGLAIRGAHYEI